ncbi:MAG TPA: discoidin domain-containing protein [Candidatus Hydrogenedentes bacterium]|nr:discoidin domain-containing protein [Candidatus Hydrogenedentota bacterium]HPG67067.1 discoidin domain-containing protein [Candidatus Hydrogenedentota bacterium]
MAFCSCCLLASVAAAQPAVPTPESTAPFINTWLVAGTFENDAENTGYDHDWIGEATVEPREGVVSAERAWRYFDDRLFSRNYDDYQDLFSYFKAQRFESVAAKVAYACIYVHSAQDCPAELRISADNEFKAWLNQDCVASSLESHPYRDGVKAGVQLRSGWNRVLLKMANQENGRFGFYARLCNADGDRVDRLTYALAPGGDLAVATKAMAEVGDVSMPTAFRAWPYVGLDPLSVSDPIVESYARQKPHLAVHASPFTLLAQGGEPPYRWTLADGALPQGLSLDADGTVAGVVDEAAGLEACSFTVRVADSVGHQAEGTLDIRVRERPNKWYEEARLVALMHNPESMLDATAADLQAFARLMKRQGYALGMMISYNNGDMTYRWPSIYEPDNPLGDLAGLYKAALEAEGLRFGMYMGNLIGPNHGGDNGAILMVEDAVRRYRPAAMWLDWASADPDGYVSLDALYSMIRSISPDTLIVLNGLNTLYHGDWDVVCLEGWGAWGDRMWATWPFPITWCKRAPLETWRMLADPAFEYSKGIYPDWQEYLRVQVSIIGEGFVANIDHSPTIRTPYTALNESVVAQAHQAMADWANPPGVLPLHESYTRVNPGPLAEAAWGYNTINLERDAIYLHLMVNPRGKTGKPDAAELVVGPVERGVTDVRWMNEGRDLEFAQAGTDVTIRLDGVSADPVDTILKLELDGPHPVRVASKIAAEIVPPGNLACYKPARLLSVDGSHPLVPSGFAFARYGVDGRVETHAQGAYEWAWAFEVDLEAVHAVRSIVIHFAPAGYATEYKLLLSADGNAWAEVANVAGCEGGTREHAFDAVSARYVRVRAVKPDGPDQPGAQMGVAELEVYE